MSNERSTSLSPRQRVATARSLLFVPANRPERFGPAASSGADAVVLDLEDAVPEEDKVVGRRHARAWLDGGGEVVVRINPASSRHHTADVDALVGTHVTVMLAKASVSTARELAGRGFAVLPLVETASALMEARELASVDGVVRLSLGHLDLAAEMGVDPENREALLWARSTMVAASLAAGLPAPIAGVTARLRAPDLVAADARYAKALGYAGKLCIHPEQVLPTHRGLMPSEDEIAWAERVLSVQSRPVSVVDQQMVDRPVMLRALAIRAAAQYETQPPKAGG